MRIRLEFHKLMIHHELFDPIDIICKYNIFGYFICKLYPGPTLYI